MHLIYIDDSRDEALCAFSALAVPADLWREAFQRVREFRRLLKKSDGIFVHTEFHAWKLVSGRGQIADRIVAKGRRCRIFKEALTMVAGLPGTRLFNAVFPAKEEERAYEWLLNRINRTMQAWDSLAILICDEGKEDTYRRLTRRMGVYNPIPSRFGVWLDSGEAMKNVPIERIIEDPFFKKSEQSYFIQLTDFCAYALLRRERPLPSKTKYGLDRAFDLLHSVCVLETNSRDPQGIIRPTK
jgi:hypothetical protein